MNNTLKELIANINTDPKNKNTHLYIITKILKSIKDLSSLKILNEEMKSNNLCFSQFINNTGENLLFEHSWKEFVFENLISFIDINSVDTQGKSSLFLHTYNDLEMLIKYGCNVNIIDNDGNNALFKAIENKEVHKIKILLLNNIDVNHRNKKSENAIFNLLSHYDIIIDRNFINIITMLHEFDNDFNIKNNNDFNFFELFFDKLSKGKIIYNTSNDIDNFEDLFLKINPDIKKISYDNYSGKLYKELLEKRTQNEKISILKKINNNAEDISLNKKRF